MYNGKPDAKSVVWGLLIAVFTLTILSTRPSYSQGIPQSVQRELDNRSMSANEARREAARLGIDLTNPESAVTRAVALGIPETIIQEMLDAIALEDRGIPQVNSEFQEVDREVPVLAGRPVIIPEKLFLPEVDPLLLSAENENGLELIVDTVLVRVPLMDRLSGIQQVDMFFFNSTRQDTLAAVDIRRVLGSKYEGMWSGQFMISSQMMSDNWSLVVSAVDGSGNDNIIDTEEFLPILRTGEELVQEDTLSIEEVLPYFGYDIFSARPEVYESTMSSPVDDGYLVGPGDELRLIVFGAAEFQHDLLVDNEGRILVPNVGQRTVAGNRLGTLRDDLRVWLARSYAGLITDPPEVLMDLSVVRLKPANVFILGEVGKPGRFPLPSNSSVFNALYSVGGPNISGSLRDIRVIRQGVVSHSVDLYEYLLSGYSNADVRLQSGDNVFIPPRGKTVTIRGAVHRPAIYELKPNESFSDLLAYAGGLRAEAYTERFQIERVIPFEQRENPTVVRDVFDYDLGTVLRSNVDVSMEDGDVITIFSIPESTNLAAQRMIRSVQLTGAVFSPGRFELSDSVRTVRDLVGMANGVTGDAFYEKVELYRLTDDLQREVISLRLEEILDDSPTQNVVLQPQDSVHIFSKMALISKAFVKVSGQVKNAGQYEFIENMTVIDLLFKAGGLTDPEYRKKVFDDRADLFRVSDDGRSEEIIPFHLGEALAGKGMASEELKPGDEIRVYALEVEVPEDLYVQISGAIKQAGKYRFREGMSLEDLILQAGGFLEGAYLKGVEVTRLDSTRDSNELATSILVPFNSVIDEGQPSFSITEQGNRLKAATQFKLKHLDRVYIRKDPDYREQQTVTVSGEINFPGTYTLLRENETLTEILRRAGGILQTGYPKGGRLLRDNLQVIVEMDKAIIGDQAADIVLLPGDEIIIPLQPNTVAVRGNVANEGLIKFEPGKRVTYYLERAGGLRPEAEAILLTQASGATYRVKRKGIFKSNPVVDEGARILVTVKPPKEPGERVDIGRTIVDGLAILSSTMTIIVLARQAFNNN